MKVHTYLTSNFGFQLQRLKIVSAYNIADVCCNSHVRESMFSTNRFTSIQGKTISWHSAFRVSLQNCRVSFDTHKQFEKTLPITILVSHGFQQKKTLTSTAILCMFPTFAMQQFMFRLFKNIFEDRFAILAHEFPSTRRCSDQNLDRKSCFIA